MAETVKMCNMPASIAARVFQMLNEDRVKVTTNYYGQEVLVTDVEPKDLVYPEGWYYAKGCFRNKHMTTDGSYSEVEMETSDGRDWHRMAKYCTLK